MDSRELRRGEKFLQTDRMSSFSFQISSLYPLHSYCMRWVQKTNLKSFGKKFKQSERDLKKDMSEVKKEEVRSAFSGLLEISMENKYLIKFFNLVRELFQ